MKRFLVFLIVVAVAAGGLYLWWQINASKVITAQVQRQAQSFFANPENLTVQNDPVKLIGLGRARVPKLVVSGQDLALRNGLRVASAKMVLTDIDVAGPPFEFRSIGSGYYVVTMTDAAVTDYLRKRGIRLQGLIRIPTDTIAVKFSKDAAVLQGQVVVPVVNKQVPLQAVGKLVPAGGQYGKVDFRVREVRIKDWKLGVKKVAEALQVLNPVVDVSEWPVMSDLKAIETTNGKVTLRGTVIGIL